jgi:hypothetical protein
MLLLMLRRLPPAMPLQRFLAECRRIGVSPDQVLAEAQIPLARLRDWQARGQVPLRSRWRVADALWYLELQQMLAAAGIERCVWFEDFRPGREHPKKVLQTMNTHFEGCDCCRARIAYIRDTFRPRPAFGFAASLVDLLPQ